MKNLLAITLITLSVLITGGYTTTVYAEATAAFFTPEDGYTPPPQSAYPYAWGKGENTPYEKECAGPWVATMTHTFNGRACMYVDIDDDHLEWDGRMIPGNDYMINWTNIHVSAIATSTHSLKIAVSGCDHVKRNHADNATLTTYYAMATPSGREPSKGSFTLAPAFNGDMPGTPLPCVDGKRVKYNQDLWARIVIRENDPMDIYEDVFYITLSFIPTP
ncbi:MAG: hypothetical protein AB1422_05555 [bacterium]